MDEQMNYETMQSMPPYMPNNFAPQYNQISNIAQLRWKDDEITSYIQETIGGYVQIQNQETGIIELKRPDYFKPKVNDEGLTSIIVFLKSHINTSIALTNISEERALILIRIQLIDIMEHLCINQERFEINRGDMGILSAIIRPIVYSQIMRSVNGHESKNFNTQSIEQNVRQDTTLQNQQNSFWSFGRKNGR